MGTWCNRGRTCPCGGWQGSECLSPRDLLGRTDEDGWLVGQTDFNNAWSLSPANYGEISPQSRVIICTQLNPSLNLGRCRIMTEPCLSGKCLTLNIQRIVQNSWINWWGWRYCSAWSPTWAWWRYTNSQQMSQTFNWTCTFRPPIGIQQSLVCSSGKDWTPAQFQYRFCDRLWRGYGFLDPRRILDTERSRCPHQWSQSAKVTDEQIERDDGLSVIGRSLKNTLNLLCVLRRWMF